jgi:hypothetical protein
MSEIEAGEGWRLLGAGEELQHCDELLTSRGWLVIPSIFIGERVNDLSTFRRRVPAKPEMMEINNAFLVEVGHSAQLFQILQPGPPDEAGDVVIGNAVEARQLADWLIRFADWREAQGDSK